MEVYFKFTFILIHLIRLCYQQDIAVCNIGFENINGVCVQQSCPNTHVLVGGACHLKPTSSSCGIGFENINGICVQQNCPNNYVPVNGVCHPKAINPPASILPSVVCQNGYTLYNGMCYPNTNTVSPPCQQKPCGIFNCYSNCAQPPETTSESITSPPPPPTTTTTPTPAQTPRPPAEIIKCPPHSVLKDGRCRLIYCPKGTPFNGRCLEPVCSDGLVWTGRACGKPEVITTILEIENNFITEVNQTGPVFRKPEVKNSVVYHTESHTQRNNCTLVTPTTETPRRSINKKCCNVITPRMCKKYDSKWVCYNRQHRRCDNICGNYTLIYLRIPKVIERHSMLVMPPNPPLEVCADDDCSVKDPIDCSGCAINQKKTCSSYCYQYICPENRCKFIDQSEYCSNNHGYPGCSSSDGCLGEWCNERVRNCN